MLTVTGTYPITSTTISGFGFFPMTLKVGLFVGREWSFPPAFIEEVARRDEGVTVEYVKVGGSRPEEEGR